MSEDRTPDLYVTVRNRRESVEHIVKVAARYGHDMARLGLEAPDLTIEWTEDGRIKVFNAAKPRRWWQRRSPDKRVPTER